jgi:hypothetical protein
MKKLFFTCLVLAAIFATTQAQTLSYSHGTKTGQIKSDGTIEDSHGSTAGHIKSDGTVEDSHGSTIGHIKSNGTVEDSHGSTIGRAPGVKREWVAVAFFFFKF